MKNKQIIQASVFISAFMEFSRAKTLLSYCADRGESPCSQSAWRTPTGAAAVPFGQIAAVQDFVLDLLPRETTERPHKTPTHIRAVKIATVARIRTERSKGPNESIGRSNPGCFSQLAMRKVFSLQRLCFAEECCSF
jgi:hypothetical protein